jgi:hypothetical protein
MHIIVLFACFSSITVRLPFTESPEGYARSTDAISSAPDNTSATTVPPNAPPSTSPKITARVSYGLSFSSKDEEIILFLDDLRGERDLLFVVL